MDHSNLFHEALTTVHDIAKNGCRNTQAWNDVLDVVDRALNEARRLDREVQKKWPRGAMAGGPTVAEPDRPYCKPDQSCCDFTCGN